MMKQPSQTSALPFVRRRRSRRILANDVEVVVSFADEAATEPHYLHDIGERGLFLRSKKLVPPGTHVSIELPALDDDPLTLTGHVVYAISPEDIASPKPTGMGVEFERLDGSQRDQLGRYLEALAAVEPPAAGRTVLVIDDDRDTRDMLQVLLELEGFTVHLAANGLRFLSTLHVDRPAAILLDVRMSWIDGFELCRAIKQNPQFGTIPVIFISARTDPSAREQGLSLGAIDYFTKPIDTERLLTRLLQVTAR